MSIKPKHIAMGNSIAMTNKLNNVLRRKRKQNPRWRPINSLEYVTQKNIWKYDLSKSEFVKSYFLPLSWRIADMLFNDTGTIVYFLILEDPGGDDKSYIYECSLPIPYDLSTAVFVRVVISFTPASETMCFNGDGTVLYTDDDVKINAYNLNIPYDISSVYSAYVAMTTIVFVCAGLMFNNIGTAFYILDVVYNDIYKYNLSTPYDLRTVSPGSIVLSVTDQTTFPQAMLYNGDGTKMFLLEGIGNNNIYQYNLSTPYDISTASYSSVAIHIATDVYTAYRSSMIFNGDGSKLYIAALNDYNRMIIEYAIIPHDSIATFNGITWNPATVPTPDLMT